MNTKFFHLILAPKQGRNSIKMLIDSEGKRLSTFSQISFEVVNFFQKLLGTTNEKIKGCSKDILAKILQTLVLNDEYLDFIKAITLEKVKKHHVCYKWRENPRFRWIHNLCF